jgi:hypothetical protein
MTVHVLLMVIRGFIMLHEMFATKELTLEGETPLGNWSNVNV